MRKEELPVTHAVRFLKENNIQFFPHFYKYQEHGGTGVASRELKADEHIIIKTIMFLTDTGVPLLVLMHGDMEVSTKNLSRLIGVKSISPADARNAEKYSGYQFGGMSPFGTRTKIQIYIEETIYQHETIFINGGRRGFLVSLNPEALDRLNPVKVRIGIEGVK